MKSVPINDNNTIPPITGPTITPTDTFDELELESVPVCEGGKVEGAVESDDTDTVDDGV